MTLKIVAGILLVATKSVEFEKSQAQEVGRQINRIVNRIDRKDIPVDYFFTTKADEFFLARNPFQQSSGTVLKNIGRFSSLSTSRNFVNNFIPSLFIQSITKESPGYLIKLNELPIAVKSRELDQEILMLRKELAAPIATTNRLSLEKRIRDLTLTKRAKLIQHQKKIAQEQENTIQAINRLMPGMKIKQRYLVSFNGLSITLPAGERDAKRLKTQGYQIWSNQRVNVVLTDSVPLINADDVWQLKDDQGKNITGQGIKIAIIDTGVDYTHQDLGGCFGQGCKVVGGYDIVNQDSDPIDDMGHGTHVAAIAAGKGALKGVAPDAYIFAYKVLNQGGWGYWDWVIEGIDRALDPNQDGDLSDAADVINLSLGGPGDPDDPVSQAVDNAVRLGTVVVVAAGNAGPAEQSILSPGTAREAITVGASYKSGGVAGFSSVGPVVWNGLSLLKPDLMAPGVSICAAQWDDWLSSSRCLGDKHIAISGTSMSAPHVAGVVALLKQKNPDWTPSEIKLVLRDTARDQGTEFIAQGYGLVDALAAIGAKKPPLVSLDPPQFEVKGKINFYGSAGGQDFKEYTLFDGEGKRPTSFSDIFSSRNPVVRGVLLRNFDTEEKNDGFHTIVLAVTDNEGIINTDRILLRVNNFEILSIGDNLNYLKGKAVVRGRIFSSGVSNYKIEWQKEGEWNTICAGIPPGTDDLFTLCEIDVSSFENGVYFFRLAIFRQGSWKFDEPIKVVVLKELLDGWPREINGFFRGPHLVSNLDEDQKKEIIIPHYRECDFNWCYTPGSLFIFEEDGKSRKIDFLSDGSQIGLDNMHSVFYDSQEKEQLISITVFNDFWSGISTGMKIIDKNGVVKYSLDPSIVPSNLSSIYPTVIFDRDQDGNPEFFSLFFDYSSGELKIYGFDKIGKILSPFPINVGREIGFDFRFGLRGVWLLPYEKEKNQNFAVVAGDFNSSRNGGVQLKLYTDIYDGGNGNLVKRLYLFDDMNKSVLPSLSFAAIDDLNRDGNAELVVGYSIVDMDIFSQDIYNKEAYKTYLKIIDHQGNLVSQKEIQGYTIKNFVIGDLGYGSPSIVATLSDTWPTTYYGQKIIAIDYTGNVLFDRNLADYNDIINGVTIGDINNDGFQDIVINTTPRWYSGSPSKLYVFDRIGNLIQSVTIFTLGEADEFWGSYPILTDLNDDGKVDVVLAYLFVREINRDYDTRIYSLGFNQTYDETKISWPTLIHDNEHTGRYIPRPNADILANGSDGPITIPYNNTATITWCGPKAQSCANALECSVSPTGWKGISGSFSTGNLSTSTIYTLVCFGLGGKNEDSVVVNVEPPPNLPDLTISKAEATKTRTGFSYRVLVSNIGTKESGPWVFQVKDGSILPARTKIFSSLKPNKSLLINGTFSRLPVTFTLDPKDLIKELNENNNTATISKTTKAFILKSLEFPQETGP